MGRQDRASWERAGARSSPAPRGGRHWRGERFVGAATQDRQLPPKGRSARELERGGRGPSWASPVLERELTAAFGALFRRRPEVSRRHSVIEFLLLARRSARWDARQRLGRRMGDRRGISQAPRKICGLGFRALQRRFGRGRCPQFEKDLLYDHTRLISAGGPNNPATAGRSLGGGRSPAGRMLRHDSMGDERDCGRPQRGGF